MMKPTVLGGEVYFIGFSSTSDRRLYTYDGDTAVVEVPNTSNAYANYRQRQLPIMEDEIYFARSVTPAGASAAES